MTRQSKAAQKRATQRNNNGKKPSTCMESHEEEDVPVPLNVMPARKQARRLNSEVLRDSDEDVANLMLFGPDAVVGQNDEALEDDESLATTRPVSEVGDDELDGSDEEGSEGEEEEEEDAEDDEEEDEGDDEENEENEEEEEEEDDDGEEDEDDEDDDDDDEDEDGSGDSDESSSESQSSEHDKSENAKVKKTSPPKSSSSLDEYWSRIRSAMEKQSVISDEELLGIAPSAVHAPQQTQL